MASDLAEMIADLPSVIVFGGVSISATFSPPTREDQTETSGVFQNYDAQAVAPVASFPSIPNPNDACWVTDATLGMDNTRCIIKSIMRDGAALTLTVKRGRV
jgi:hypothetical protein